MLHLADIFEAVDGTFNDASFTEHYFVVHTHQRVFHVALYFGDELHTVVK